MKNDSFKMVNECKWKIFEIRGVLGLYSNDLWLEAEGNLVATDDESKTAKYVEFCWEAETTLLLTVSGSPTTWVSQAHDSTDSTQSADRSRGKKV